MSTRQNTPRLFCAPFSRWKSVLQYNCKYFPRYSLCWICSVWMLFYWMLALSLVYAVAIYGLNEISNHANGFLSILGICNWIIWGGSRAYSGVHCTLHREYTIHRICLCYWCGSDQSKRKNFYSDSTIKKVWPLHPAQGTLL